MNTLKIEKFNTPEGLINARISRNGKIITLHSSRPFEEARRITTRFNSSLNWILIAGFGLGYIVEYLLENTQFNIIVFEHSDEILQFSEETGNSARLFSNPRVHLIKYDISGIIDFLDKNSIKELSFYIHRPYYTLFPEIYSSLEGILIAYLSKKNINKATLKRFQKVWLKNTIKNSLFYFKTPGIIDIRHNFEKKPAVIIGAGPSLSKNIEILKEYMDKVVIISTDTAYANLCGHGIQADFVISVDPQDKNMFYLLYAFNNKTALVMDSAASFLGLLKYNPSNTYFFDTIFPFYNELKQFWGEKGSLLCGGSVSTTAFDLARYLKCDPIIFIGQDLAYSKKHTHIKGSILEEFLYYKINRFQTYEAYNSKMLLLSDRIEIDGWNNTKAATDRKFLTFLDWFQKEIQFTNAEVINSTEGGALIKGAKHIPLKEALLQIKSLPVLNKNFKTEFQSKDEAGYIDILKEIGNEIDHQIIFSKKASEASRSALRKYHLKKQLTSEFKAMSDFDQIFLKCIQGQSLLARLIEFTMQDSIERILETQEHESLSPDLLEAWNKLYEEAFDGLFYLQRIIKKRLLLQ